MTNQAVSISLQQKTAETYADIWCNFNQGNIKPSRDQFANFSDIANMLIYSQSGLTAHDSIHCDAEITSDFIKIPMVVNVWPSKLDLNYKLILPENIEKLNVERVAVENSKMMIVGLSDTYSFDHLIDIDVSKIKYDTPFFNKCGEEISCSDPEIVGNKLVFEKEVFVAAWIDFKALGYAHKFVFLFKNTAEDIAEIKEIVSAGVPGERGVNISGTYSADMSTLLEYTASNAELVTKELTLAISADAGNCLEQCPDGRLKGGSNVSISNPEEEPRKKLHTDVYYSVCDGHVLDTHKRWVEA